MSPIRIANVSALDFNDVTAPLKLSCMVPAIFPAAPSALPKALSSFPISLSLEFISAKNPDMAFFPTNVFAAETFSDSESPENASRVSPRMSFKLRMDPSALVVWMRTFPMLFPETVKSFDSPCMIVRSDVPACVLLMPWLAINPRASVVSSTEYPREPATGAAYLNDSPSIWTFVLLFADAVANTSAKCPLSLADKPNAVKASVTMSDVVAKSSPDAAAKSITPLIPESMSPVFHPAMAM